MDHRVSPLRGGPVMTAVGVRRRGMTAVSTVTPR